MKKIEHFLLAWPKPFIFGTDFCSLLNKSPNSRHAIIKRAVQDGLLLPLRRDLFLIAKHSARLDTFEMSLIIYGPSYISFESALSFHGWIPEAVRSTTCATTKRSTCFETPLGLFSYEHIPLKAFALGVEQHQSANTTLFIANPWKALADIIYSRKKVWLTLSELAEDLRIELACFTDSNKALLADLLVNYPNKRVKNVLYHLQQGLNS